MFGRPLIAALVLWSTLASAQTPWPDYISALEPEAADSPVTAALPPGSAVQAPDAALPRAQARWSGIWSGWACRSRVCDIKLAVEQVTARGATVVYAAGSSAQGRFSERFEAVFDGDELQGTLASGARLALRMRNDSVIEMLLRRRDAVVIGGVLAPQGTYPARLVERIPTPFMENGKPVSLEVVIFKPPGPGPFPLLMLNHGSTGRGNDPALFTGTWTGPTLVKYFVDKGWLVAFPQRRGRGKSDGLYDEGFAPDRSGYACEPERSLPGFDRALADTDAAAENLLARPDVDRQRALIGGVSRGGILAVAYAGTHPTRFRGVVNFVGGWMGDGCRFAEAINIPSFRRGAPFPKPTLWLYGENDSFYKIAHSRANFDAFVAAGGSGTFNVYTRAAGQNGHFIASEPELWREAMDAYLEQLGLR